MYTVTLALIDKLDTGGNQKSWQGDTVCMCDGLLEIHGYGSFGEAIKYTVNLKNADSYRLIITKESEDAPSST